MAKEIIWSERAISDRKNILRYWILKNQSKIYSVKLDELFREAVRLISVYPIIGKETDISKVRAKKLREYVIFYQQTGTQIHILKIWSPQQNPLAIRRGLRMKR
jgi:plasmid stabilization system protein ParE